MENRFKAGDLALIIRAKHEKNIGKVVTLKERTDASVIRIRDQSGVGVVENASRLACWIVTGELVFQGQLFDTETDTGVIPEGWLMPLRGDDAPADTMVTGKPRAVPA